MRSVGGNLALRPAAFRRGVLPARAASLAAGALLLVLLGALAAREPLAAALAVAVVVALTALVLSPRPLALATVGALALVPVVGGLAEAGLTTPTGPPSIALKLVDDVALAPGLVLLALRAGVFRRHPLAWFMLRCGLALLVLSELMGILSSHGPASLAVQAAWQDLRWLGVIGWGLFVADLLPPRSVPTWAFRLLLAWNLGNIVVSAGQMVAGNTFSPRLGIPLTEGLFHHPTVGAIAAGSLVVFVLADRFGGKPLLTDRQHLVGVAAGLLSIIVSTRFKVLLAIGAVLLFVWLLRRTRGLLLPAVATALLPVMLTFGFLLTTRYYANANTNSTNPLQNALSHAPTRGDLVEGGVRLASRSFPAGWGLGTYGSELDTNVEVDSFFVAGLGGVYGFTAAGPTFRADSLTARVLGERGFIGLVLWVAGLALIIAGFLLRKGRSPVAAASLVAALALTPVAPAFTSGTIAFVLLLGGAMLIAPEARRESATGLDSPSGESR